MYIHKICEIKNCGKIISFDRKSTDWNCVLSKINTIYAPNGSGKTTLSVIFDSLHNKDVLLAKKKTLNTKSEQHVILENEEKKAITFSKGKWNFHDNSIEVFNSFYLEDNTYSISINSSLDEINIFEKYHETEILEINNLIVSKMNDLQKARNKVQNSKNYYKKKQKDYARQKTYKEAVDLRDNLADEIQRLKEQKIELYEDAIEAYKQAINRYLSMFTMHMKILEIKIVNTGMESYNLVYGIEIDSNCITIEERNKLSLKYILSDGDKNALGLSFFLAKFDLIKDTQNFLVVIDDPFTSFDTQRKVTTLSQLSRLANRVKQFILLTHDMQFAYDFSNKYSIEPIKNLRINSLKEFSIEEYDIDLEMQTGLAKDIYELRNFESRNSNDQMYLREVCRCIRPSIEGIFRVKYSNYISPGQWLGNFIELIRKASDDSPFKRLQPYLSELVDINDYSKIYHHSNPNYFDILISELELANMVKRTLKLIEVL